MYLKTPPMRSEPYRRWVAARPCIACGVDGYSQAAHANHGKGLGLKVCDSRIFPLCAPHWGLIGCHQQHDLLIDMDRDERREREADYIERTQAAAIEEGWTFDGRIRKAVCRV